MTSYRALLINDARWNADNLATEAEGSDYLEVGPRPGVPVCQDDVRSKMTLQASGDIPATGDVTVTVVDTGFPGGGARIKWRSETAGTTYGWDGPTCITGMEYVSFVADAGTAFRVDHPFALTLQSGDVLIACRIAGTTLTGSNTEYATGIFKLTVSTGAIAYVSRAFASTDDQTGAEMRSPALVQLPSGRVLCIDWDVSSSTQGLQLMVAYSDDDGATWSDYSRRALASPIDDGDYDVTAYSRLRAAYSNGQILLVAHLTDTGVSRLAQWASDDLGATFRTVSTSVVFATSPNVLPRSGGGFVVMYCEGTTVTCKSVSSAFDNFYSKGTSITTPPNTSDDVCMWASEDGTLWAAGTSATDQDAIWTMVSRDEGDTWYDTGSIDSAEGASGNINGGIWPSGESGMGFERYSMAEYRGRTIMVTECNPDSDTHAESSLLALYLGGHSNINLPRSPRSAYGRDNDLIGWRLAWVGFEDPADIAAVWGATSLGTPTTDIDTNGWDIQLDAGETLYYDSAGTYMDDADISATDYLFLFELTPNTGGSTSTDDIAASIQLADGTDDYSLTLRVSGSGFAIYDNHAGANAFTPLADTLTNTQILVFVKGSSGVVRTYYRTGITPGLPLRTFTSGGSGTLTNDTGSPAAGAQFQWGHLSAVAGATRAHWRIVAHASAPSSYGYDPSLTSHVGGRHLSTVPITIGNGTKIAGFGGPAIAGESWQVLPEFSYGVEKMFPQLYPSPRQTFQSEKQGPTLIAVKLDNELTVTDSTSVGLALRNTNIREFSIEGYNGGAWVAISGTITNGWTDLAFQRKGDVLVVDTGATTSDEQAPWLAYERLVGGYVYLDDGVGGTSACRIIHNTSGRWSQETGLRAVLQLHPDDVAGSPSSGTAWIVPKDVTVLLLDLNDSYSRVRLSVPNASYPAADNDRIRIGVCMYGPVVYFGKQYSATRSIELQPNVDLQTRRSGTRTSRVLGPTRRRIAFAWLDPIDTRQLAAAGSTSPTSYAATTWASSAAVAAKADTPLLVEGLLERLQGSHTPVVYLPKVDQEAGAGSTVVVTICDPNLHEYARIVTSSRRETVVGDESETEAVRIAEIVLETEI